jgi:hypothetical protein
MERAPTRSKQPLQLQRACECSRLAADLLASVYERIVPRPQSSTTGRQRTIKESEQDSPFFSSEGVSA